MNRTAIVVCAIATWQIVCGAQPEHSTSPSRQFVIYGGDAKLRGAVSALAEQTKSNFLGLLQQRDDWKIPVLINLQPQQANLPEMPPTHLRFTQTGFGIKLQLDLTIAKEIDVSLFEHELLRAISLEMMYRKQLRITAGAVLVEPPDWLLDGALALAPTCDRGQFVDALVATQKPLSLSQFLGRRAGVDHSADRTLYRAYALAFVQMLLDAENGGAQLAKYLERLANSSDERSTDLEAEFSSLAGDAERTWQRTLNRVKSFQTFRLLTFVESERRLDELLRVKIPQPKEQTKVMELDELARHKLSASEKGSLDQLKRDLMFFVPQSNPVLRPVGREYQEVVALLARGKRWGVPKRLARLNFTRQQLAAMMIQIDDYMNWFEATQMDSDSGNFSGYLKAVNQSQVPAPRRHDPLSAYVDALEDQFDN
jgi:hypothetical protein